jgi:hypothetical protein
MEFWKKNLWPEATDSAAAVTGGFRQPDVSLRWHIFAVALKQ